MAERKKSHRKQIRSQASKQYVLEGPASRETRTEAGSENCQNDLRDKHHSIAGIAETEAVGTGENGTCRWKCNQRQPLEESCHINEKNFSSPRHRKDLLVEGGSQRGARGIGRIARRIKGRSEAKPNRVLFQSPFQMFTHSNRIGHRSQ